MTEEKKIWFPTKRYGYGWGLPCSWEGWVVFVGYIALILADAAEVARIAGGVCCGCKARRMTPY